MELVITVIIIIKFGSTGPEMSLLALKQLNSTEQHLS